MSLIEETVNSYEHKHQALCMVKKEKKRSLTKMNLPFLFALWQQLACTKTPL